MNERNNLVSELETLQQVVSSSEESISDNGTAAALERHGSSVSTQAQRTDGKNLEPEENLQSENPIT